MQHTMNTRRISNAPRQRRDVPPPKQHTLNMEIINFIVEAWNQVSRDYKNKSSCLSGNIAEAGPMAVSYYQPPDDITPEVHTLLAGFRPVDLEQLWGRRMVDLQNRSS